VQLPPLTSWTISLWFAVAAIILLITVQLASSYNGPATLLANLKRLRYAALAMGLLFLTTVAIRIYQMIVTT